MGHTTFSHSLRVIAGRCSHTWSESPRRGGVRAARGGFTILEVMMAAAVMAFAITTSITTMQRAFMSLDTARNITIAGQIMQSEFEKMRLRDWSVIGSYTLPEAEVTIDSAFTSNAFINTRFKMYRTVTEINMGTGI